MVATLGEKHVMTYILFFDVDGTLVTQKDGQQYIPPSALAAMRDARRRGCRLYLCTGRSLAEARTIGDLPVDGIIGAAGGFVLDGETMVAHQTLGEEAVCEIEAYLQFCGGNYYLECNEGLYADEGYRAYMSSAWGIDDNPAFLSIVHSVDEADRSRVNKVSFRIPEGTSFEQVQEALGARFHLVRSSFDSSATAGEVSVMGVSKATAIDELLDYLDLGEVRTFGFGDSMNDAEMLQRCDEAIVMGDARHPEMKELATYVTASVLEDGIAQAMRHFGLA